MIEDASTGIALAQELNDILVFCVVEPIPIDRDKIGRLYVQQAKFDAGRVLFPKGASFLPELETELLSSRKARRTTRWIASPKRSPIKIWVLMPPIVGSWENPGNPRFNRDANQRMAWDEDHEES